MLLISRQREEAIVIGENIVVTIVDIRGDKVRLGIQAPTEIPVYRTEVHQAIQRENQRASSRQYGQFLECLGRGKFEDASRLYYENSRVRDLMTGDQISRLEKGLGRKLE